LASLPTSLVGLLPAEQPNDPPTCIRVDRQEVEEEDAANVRGFTNVSGLHGTRRPEALIEVDPDLLRRRRRAGGVPTSMTKDVAFDEVLSIASIDEVSTRRAGDPHLIGARDLLW